MPYSFLKYSLSHERGDGFAGVCEGWGRGRGYGKKLDTLWETYQAFSLLGFCC